MAKHKKIPNEYPGISGVEEGYNSLIKVRKHLKRACTSLDGYGEDHVVQYLKQIVDAELDRLAYNLSLEDSQVPA